MQTKHSQRIQYIIGALATPVAIGGLPMVDTHPLIAYSMFTIAVVLGIISLCLFAFRKRRRKRKKLGTTPKEKLLPKINYENIDKVTQQDKDLIQFMSIRMMSTHGHGDLTGLLSDSGSGVPTNELMEKPCSLCGMPRSRRGMKINAL